MIYFLTFVVIVGVLVLACYGIGRLVEYRTRAAVLEVNFLRAECKRNKEIFAIKTTAIQTAKSSLNKISADYTHNPQLEARTCLDAIESLEIKEYNL